MRSHSSGFMVRTKKVFCPTPDITYVSLFLIDNNQIKSARQSRERKSKETTEAVQKQNEKYSRQNLMALVDENFDSGDYFLTETFPTSMPDEDRKQEHLNFIRRLNYAYEKILGDRPRYVYCSERGENGFLHIHTCLSGDMPIEDVQKVWKKSNALKNGGNLNIQVIERDTENSIALYLAKSLSEPHARRKNERLWTASQNCKRPVVTVEDDKISLHDFKKLTELNNWGDEDLIKRIFHEYKSYSITDFDAPYNEVVAAHYCKFKVYKPRYKAVTVENTSKLSDVLHIGENEKLAFDKPKSEQTDNQKSKERISHFNDYVYENYTKPYYRQMGIYLE